MYRDKYTLNKNERVSYRETTRKSNYLLISKFLTKYHYKHRRKKKISPSKYPQEEQERQISEPYGTLPLNVIVKLVYYYQFTPASLVIIFRVFEFSESV